MNNDSYFIDAYERVKDTKTHLSELSTVQLIGYYRSVYPKCAVDKLLDDMTQSKVPNTLGVKALSMLECLEAIEVAV